jgi:hypothetical protein
VLPTGDILSRVEKTVGSLLEEAAEEVRQETFRILKVCNKPQNSLPRA